MTLHCFARRDPSANIAPPAGPEAEGQHGRPMREITRPPRVRAFTPNSSRYEGPLRRSELAQFPLEQFDRLFEGQPLGDAEPV
jgi:hypothetical protein